MLRRIALAVVALVALGVVGLGALLVAAHVGIRRERAPLPAPAELNAAAAASAASGPVRLWVVNTASQSMPRSAVLERRDDPDPQAPFAMSYPAFLLQWADGRMLLVDAGMTRDAAVEFGRPAELLIGAGPVAPLGSVGERLGSAASKLQGIVFTHLHSDHVGGIADVCRVSAHPVRVPMSPAQAQRTNYTTAPSLRLLTAAPCVRLDLLRDGSLLPVPGFPGVFIIPSGGHTPDSQIVVVFVGGPDGPRRYAFIGDLVNDIDGIEHDLPKPWIYRALIIPEDDTRMAELRRYLRGLRDQDGFTLLPSHDQRQIEASGVPAWTAPASPGGRRES